MTTESPEDTAEGEEVRSSMGPPKALKVRSSGFLLFRVVRVVRGSPPSRFEKSVICRALLAQVTRI